MNDDRAKFVALTDAKPQAQQGYRCGHCGYEGPCYGQPTSSGVSAPWCKQCGMNNKLSALASAQAASAELEEQVANLAAALRKEVEAPAFDPEGLTPAPNIARRLTALADELDAELDSGATWSKAQHTCNSVSVALREVANAAQAASAEPVAPYGYVIRALCRFYTDKAEADRDARLTYHSPGGSWFVAPVYTTPAPAVAPAAVTDEQTPEFRERVLEIAHQLRSGDPNRPTQREAAALIEDWYLATRTPEPAALSDETCSACKGSGERTFYSNDPEWPSEQGQCDRCYGTGALATRTPEPQAEQQCRDDGRCQYAIDHGAEGLGHCPRGKCAMPQPDSRGQAWWNGAALAVRQQP